MRYPHIHTEKGLAEIVNLKIDIESQARILQIILSEKSILEKMAIEMFDEFVAPIITNWEEGDPPIGKYLDYMSKLLELR